MIKFWDPVVTSIGSNSLLITVGSNSPFRASLMKPKRPERDPRGLQVNWCGFRIGSQDKLMMNYWILCFVMFCWCRCCSQFGVVFFSCFSWQGLVFVMFPRPVVDPGMSQRPLNQRFFQSRCWMTVALDSGQNCSYSYELCKMCHHELWWYNYIFDVMPCWRTCGFELSII